ncbi:peptidase M41 FtsH extracellular [Clostridium sp. DL-VIII]|uniref:ATP-dependent metallopeptidase FtsH/Yme1/Tma family protein n=1 Tax=Clostridium sp. DL-VIII TaxID=641107 RepID=UPI00023B0188|nr:ATP-dependent metallopeptidase FtsH/Yme1/Tma family protein [Clostridium sp. DL-VIII]EHI99869.1 peptidase M41 FtsH extracellular [Clostridium sp. DL-VIII]
MHKNKRKVMKMVVIFLTILVVFLIGFNYLRKPNTTKEISYNQFMSLLDENQVSKVVIMDEEIKITPRDNSEYKAKTLYTLNIDDGNLIAKLQKLKVNYDIITQVRSTIVSKLIALVIILLFVYFILRNKSLKSDKKRLLIKIRNLEDKDNI